MKSKHRHNRVKRVGAPRVYGGAFGRKVRKPGKQQLRKGIVRTRYGQNFLVYDNAVILKKPISIDAAFIEWIGGTPGNIDPKGGFFKKEGDKARAFFKSRCIPEEPILAAGALILDRGRIWQPWVKKQYYAFDAWKVAQDLQHLLKQYRNFAEIATTKATAKTGVIGWFIRARTESFKPRKKRAKANTNKKRSKTRATVSRVGRGSKTRVRRRGRKH